MKTVEELHEALLSLRQIHDRLRIEHEHANLLIGAFDSLLRIKGDGDPFSSVFASLRSVFTFDKALVLVQDGPASLECIVAEPQALVGLKWKAGRFFRRVLDGRVTTTFSNADIEEWSAIPPDVLSPGHPALYLPVAGGNERGILILLRAPGDGGFLRSHVALAQRFSLLASHAIAARQARQLILENQSRAIAAEDASNTKSMFIANMSHELRTPLNAILGFSECIATELLGPIGDPKYKEYASNVLASGTHLLAIVNNLLLLSKMDAKQHSSITTTVLLCDEVAYVVEMMHIEARRKGIDLATAQIAMDIAVIADRQSLRQILLNIVSNAIKFSASGGAVRIELASAADKETCKLRVIDQGCGIPAAVLCQLGNPFVQAEGVYARHHQGTGLGLAISYGLAKAMGASISTESVERVGTTVTLEMPRARLSDQRLPQSAA